MDRFVTLEHSHPEFTKHLLGEIENDSVAIPVKSFHINQSKESVTFQILPRGEIRRPSIFKILVQVFRVDLLALTFMPALVTVMQNPSGIQNGMLVVFSLLSLLFLHAAVFCRNDFVDHMKGIDRLNEKSGSRVIQQGWLRAKTVRNLYWTLLLAATALAVPVFIELPEMIILAAAVAVLGVLGYSHLRWASTYWLLGDLAIWSCLGVFITLSMSWVSFRELNLLSFLLGSFFGFMAVLYVEVRHMMSLFIDYEARLMTLPVRVGFDLAKIVAVGIIFLALGTLVLITTIELPHSLSLVGLPAAVALIFLAKKIYTAASPLSSSLYELPKTIINTYVLTSLYFIILSWI